MSPAPQAFPSAPSASWLLLAYQLPSQPSNARVATWRRLQRVGAVQVQGSVYALPATAEAREDFEWIAEEVVGHGGQATLFTAAATEARAHDEIVEAFRRARAKEYEAIRADASARKMLAPRLRERLAATIAVDFFAAAGRDQAEASIAALERKQEDTMPTTESNAAAEARLATRDFRDRIWVTRPRPGIDRMSTAWLVRRFIDPAATFRFADPDRRSELGPTAVPFDMYGVELGHQRGGCTFETVVRRFAIDDAAVARLARIVHQLDLKTEEQPAPEAAVIGNMVEGLRRMYADDAELLERGIVMFESLYRAQSEQRSATAAAASKANKVSPTSRKRPGRGPSSSRTKRARSRPKS